MTNKLQKLKYAADDIGMALHPTKCQFLTVNSNDTAPFMLGNATISQTDCYTYLGAHISNDTVINQAKNPLYVNLPCFLRETVNAAKTLYNTSLRQMLDQQRATISFL